MQSEEQKERHDQQLVPKLVQTNCETAGTLKDGVSAFSSPFPLGFFFEKCGWHNMFPLQISIVY